MMKLFFWVSQTDKPSTYGKTDILITRNDGPDVSSFVGLSTHTSAWRIPGNSKGLSHYYDVNVRGCFPLAACYLFKCRCFQRWLYDETYEYDTLKCYAEQIRREFCSTVGIWNMSARTGSFIYALMPNYVDWIVSAEMVPIHTKRDGWLYQNLILLV